VAKEEPEGISDYEQMRLDNIKRNQGLLVELGIDEIKGQLKLETKAKPRTKKVRVASSPARRSGRSQGLDPNGEKIEKKVGDFTLRNPFYDELGVFGDDPDSKEVRIARFKKCERLDDEPIVTAERFVSFVSGKGKAKKIPSSKKAYLANLAELTIDNNEERSVGKAVPERAFSLAWHPSASTHTVFVGDKWGTIGCWNTASKKPQDVASFQPHCRPVSALLFSPNDCNKLYSCSYDGTLRMTDLAASGGCLTSTLVYGTEKVSTNADWNGLKSIDIYGQTCFAARGDGRVAILDLRSKAPVKGAGCCPQLHGKKLNVNSVHVRVADGGNYLATASKDKTVRVWDLRKLSSKSTGSTR
jgi:WD40 repeat protein